MDRKTLTVKEVSQWLGIGINQTYALVKKDGFPKLRIGTQYLIPKKEFEEWVSNNSYAGEKI